MIADLHTHSTASDGALAPAELLELARVQGVDVLSITDHDTLDAYADLALQAGSPRLIAGVELSTTWNGRGIHIVGLNIDLTHPELCRGIAAQKKARTKRAATIAARLAQHGIADTLEAAQGLAAGGSIGRPHFARVLVERGHSKDTRAAFKTYLGAGKAGDVRHGWASMADVVAWIVAAGGIAVLAHPGKYRMTRTKLCALLDDFVACGGGALEVVCGPQDRALTERLAKLVLDYDLLASTGSDFHDPANAWSRPGRFEPLPGNLCAVWEAW